MHLPLPPMTCRLGYFSLIYLIMLIWKIELPWDESWRESGRTKNKKWNLEKTTLTKSVHKLNFLLSPPYQHDHIHATLYQQVQSVLVVIVGANCGATQQLFARVFWSQREVSVLLQVRAGDDGHQVALVVHYGQFACRRREDWTHIYHHRKEDT